MLTIMEFLRARLNEDEQVAWAARSAPARVLADIAVKRRILAAWEDVEHRIEVSLGLEHPVAGVDTGRDTAERLGGADDALRTVVRLTASVYDDHPDYDESWRP